MAARRAGDDIIDMGFGNPDMPTPEHIVDKLGEAIHDPRNHGYSASRERISPADDPHELVNLAHDRSRRAELRANFERLLEIEAAELG